MLKTIFNQFYKRHNTVYDAENKQTDRKESYKIDENKPHGSDDRMNILENRKLLTHMERTYVEHIEAVLAELHIGTGCKESVITDRIHNERYSKKRGEHYRTFEIVPDTNLLPASS